MGKITADNLIKRFHNFFAKDIITLILLENLAALVKTSVTILVVINLARLHVQTNNLVDHPRFLKNLKITFLRY